MSCRRAGNAWDPMTCPDCGEKCKGSGALIAHRRGKKCLVARTKKRWAELGFVPLLRDPQGRVDLLLYAYPARYYFEASTKRPEDYFERHKSRDWVRAPDPEPPYIAQDYFEYVAGSATKESEVRLGYWVPQWLYEVFRATAECWIEWGKNCDFPAARLLEASRSFYRAIGEDLELRAAAITVCKMFYDASRWKVELGDGHPIFVSERIELAKTLIDMVEARSDGRWR